MKSDPRPESPTNHLSRKADFASRVFIQCGEFPLNLRIWHRARVKTIPKSNHKHL